MPEDEHELEQTPGRFFKKILLYSFILVMNNIVLDLVLRANFKICFSSYFILSFLNNELICF